MHKRSVLHGKKQVHNTAEIYATERRSKKRKKKVTIFFLVRTNFVSLFIPQRFKILDKSLLDVYGRYILYGKILQVRKVFEHHHLSNK